MRRDETCPPADQGQSRERGRTRRIACAEINARRVNEALERGRTPQPTETFLCECGEIGCSDKLHVPLVAYLNARGRFERFLVAPGHDADAIDEVIERCDGYWVVDKRGEAVVLAREAGARDVTR